MNKLIQIIERILRRREASKYRAIQEDLYPVATREEDVTKGKQAFVKLSDKTVHWFDPYEPTTFRFDRKLWLPLEEFGSSTSE